MMKQVPLAALVAAFTFVPAAAAAVVVKKPLEQTMPVEPDGTVSIHNVSGSVRVRIWDRDEVRLVATLGDGVEELVFRRHGPGAEVRVEHRRGCGDFSGSDLVLDVPRAAPLRIRVVSARVDVEAGARLEVQTVSGNVVAKTTGAEVNAETVSGDLELEAGPVALDLATVSGTMEIGADRVTSLRARSVSGDLRLKVRAIDEGTHRVKSQSGRTELEIPDGVPVRVHFRGFREERVLGDDRPGVPTIDVTAFSGKVSLERT